MDKRTSLTEVESTGASGGVAESKLREPAVPSRKAVKKKSTIAKLVIIGVLLVVGLIFAFCPMQFGFTNYYPFCSKESISLGLDLQGGVYAVYRATQTDTENFESKMEGTRSSLESLLVSKGYTEATVVREGEDRIRVEVPDVEDTSAILDIIGEPAEISFVLDSTKETVLTGEDVVGAQAFYSANDGGYVVSLELTTRGQEKFFEATSNHINETMSIIVTIGGESTTISSPTINSAISGNAIISGNFTSESAERLANQIMSGTFDVALELKESETISPTLGNDALKYGLIAGIVGFVLVIAFICVVYRMLGVAASLALLIYVVLYLFFLAVLPWVQLTLPGIAGILLSIGMAVDANIIIFERIKDEYRNGKSIMTAYHAGFKKALFAILDSNVTTVIACVLLLLLGTGSIKGFALTLLVGVLLSLFTSLVVSRMLVKCFINLNSYNEKLYHLKRGKQYANLSADATDASIMEVMQREEEKKKQEKEEKQRIKELEKSARKARRTQEKGGEQA